MKNLTKVILWLAFLTGGIMLTRMCERDWPCVAWVIFWVVVGVVLIEINQASDQDDDKMIMG